MITETEDTIVAIATPLGRAALGMIRISGKNCCDILPKVFQPKTEGVIIPFRPLLGKIILDSGKFVDEALLTYFKQPHSYTREDVAEITCHGNPLILEQVVNSVVSSGARLARPGEFTYRAFLNGRLDLVQAEAVNELITADSVYQAELALQQLDGRLSGQFQELRDKFIELISLLEGNVDFSEEQHYNFIDQKQALERLDGLIQKMSELLGTFDRGRLIREGFHVALVGKPNVGKSSVFNYLLGQNRAIVTAIPGTTRDFLRERITIGNFLIQLHDTAGIRESSEVVEEEGIRRSRQVLESADLVVFVVDGSSELEEEDFKLWQETAKKDRLVICNKNDLPHFRIHQIEDKDTIEVSAVSGSGMNRLIEVIQSRAETRVRFGGEDFLISNLRHRDILKQTIDIVRRAREAVAQKMSEEFALSDLHQAVLRIGEITGEVTMEDIYTQIFKKFCIGK